MLKQTGVSMSTEVDTNTPEQVEKTDLQRYEEELAALPTGTAQYSAKLDIVNLLKKNESQELAMEAAPQTTQRKLGAGALRRFFGTRR